MKRKQLAHLFARAARRSPGRAADDIDALVYRMLKDLKRPFTPAPAPPQRSTAPGAAGPKQER